MKTVATVSINLVVFDLIFFSLSSSHDQKLCNFNYIWILWIQTGGRSTFNFIGHYTLTEKVTSGTSGNIKEKPIIEIRIAEKNQESEGQLQDREVNSTKIATELSSASTPAATPIFINDLEQGVKYMMRKENEEVARMHGLRVEREGGEVTRLNEKGIGELNWKCDHLMNHSWESNIWTLFNLCTKKGGRNFFCVFSILKLNVPSQNYFDMQLCL